jgi:DNA replication and repair protein RecF
MGFLPLLLLDDVSSELDPERNAYLMNYLSASGAQVFLTTTDASLVRGAAAEDTLWLGVRSGTVTSPAPSALQSEDEPVEPPLADEPQPADEPA